MTSKEKLLQLNKKHGIQTLEGSQSQAGTSAIVPNMEKKTAAQTKLDQLNKKYGVGEYQVYTPTVNNIKLQDPVVTKKTTVQPAGVAQLSASELIRQSQNLPKSEIGELSPVEAAKAHQSASQIAEESRKSTADLLLEDWKRDKSGSQTMGLGDTLSQSQYTEGNPNKEDLNEKYKTDDVTPEIRDAARSVASQFKDNPLTIAEQSQDASTDTKQYKYMSQEEKDKYNTLYGLYGKEKAEEYRHMLFDEINKRIAEDEYNSLFSSGVGNKTFDELWNGLKKGTYTLTQSAQGAVGDIVSKNAKLDTGRAEANTVGDYIAQKIRTDENNSEVGNIALDLLSSTGNMAPGMIAGTVTGNPVIGDLVFALGAQGNAYREALQDGNTQTQAKAYSWMQAADEAVTNFILGGIGKLGGGILTKAVGNKFGKQLAEGLAKTFKNNPKVAEAIYSTFKLLGNSSSEAAQEYLQYFTEVWEKELAGMKDSDGNPVSSKDFHWNDEEAFYSAMLGALNAGILNAGDIKNYNHEYKDTLIDSAVDEISKKGEDGIDVEKYGSLTAEDMDEVARRVNDEIQEEEREDLKEEKTPYQNREKQPVETKNEQVVDKVTESEVKETPVQETVEDEHEKLIRSAVEDLMNSETEIDESKYNGKFTEDDIEEILRRVDEPVQEKQEVNESTVQKAINEETKNAEKKGTVDTSMVDMKSIGRKKQVHMDVVNGFIASLGANVEWYTSKADENGKYHGENGSYDARTNTFRFDTNAGAMDVNDSAKLNTAVSHEVTHWMEQNSREAYDEIRSIVLETLNEDGRVEERINAEQSKLDEYYGPGHTREEAEAEIVARACEDMLSESSKAKEIMNRMSEETKTTFVERVRELIDKIRGYYKGVLNRLNADSEEAKRIRYNMESFEKLAKTWNNALSQRTGGETEKKTQYSDRDYSRQQAEKKETVTRESLPLKAKVVVTRSRNNLIKEVGKIIKANTMDNINDFRKLTNVMVDEYLETGNIKEETIRTMFEDAYKYSDAEAEVKADESMKYYQLEEFKRSVEELKNDLKLARRYAVDKESGTGVTSEDVQEAYKGYVKARAAAERVKANELLTSKDYSVLGMLLRGETTMEEAKKMKDLNLKGIEAVYAAQKPYEDKTRTIRQFNKERKEKLAEEADALIQGSENWKDKKSGIQYERETAERNIRDIAPEGEAEALINTYFAPVHSSEAESTRLKNKYRDQVKEMNISRKIEKGNQESESYAVQFIGEAEDNMRRAAEKGKQYGRTKEEWQDEINKFFNENPNMDKKKIYDAIETFSQIYKELREKANEVLIRNGYEPIEYRAGYFPHFQEQENDSIIDQFKKVFGVETDVSNLPTTINGRTGTFKPGRTWFGNVFSRLGTETKVDAVQGFDKYIQGISDVIYQTDNIQKLRTLAQQIRYNASDEGIQKEIDKIKANDELTWEEQRLQINELLDSNKDYALSNFVVWLEEYTNILANKKSKLDRVAETEFGRRIYNAVKTIEGNVAGNMVALNPASWLTNLIPITQAMTTTEQKYLLKGMVQTLSNQKVRDNFVDRSDFLTNRIGSDNLVKRFEQDANPMGLAKVSQGYAGIMDKLSVGMNIFDDFAAESIVRGRYLQNKASGMSEALAMDEANAYAASIMADRSKGSQPTLFASRNPLVKAFTMFQLEVNNEFSWLAKDIPRELRKKSMLQIAAALFKFLIGTYIFNDVYEFIVGRRPALDPLNIVNDTVGDLSGYKLPNMIDAALGREGLKTEKKTLNQAGKDLGSRLADELPFSAMITGGGRIPVSSALPDAGKLYDVATKEMSGKKKAETLAKELGTSALYLTLPGGGGQIKKVVEGEKAVAEGGSYTYDNEGELNLQYPVYKDTLGDVIGASVKAALFGKSSLYTARKWVDNGFDTLNAEKTELYNNLQEAGMTDRDSYRTVKEISEIKKTEEESANNLKKQYIEESDMTEEQKEIVYFDRVTADDSKEKKLYEELGTDAGKFYDLMTEYHKADNVGTGKTAEQISAIRNSKLSEEEKSKVYYEMNCDSGSTDRQLIDTLGYKAADVLMSMRGKGSAKDGGKTTAEKYEDIRTANISEEMKKEIYLQKIVDKDSRERVSKEIREYEKQGISFDEFLQYKPKLNGFTSEEDGKTKQEKVVEYIKTQSEEKWKALWSIAGYEDSSYSKYFGGNTGQLKSSSIKTGGNLKTSESLKLKKPGE